MKDTSSYRETLSKLDIDPGYFSKYIKDQIVLKTIQDADCKSILDIGCDTCYIYDILQARKHEFEYLGVDKNMLKNMQVRDNNFWFMQSDNIFETLDKVKKDKKFDCILLLDVIEHMANKEEGLKLIDACIELMDKGSYLIISTPNCMNGVINWPKYHQFEYSAREVLNYIVHKRNMSLQDFIGWSMSTEQYQYLTQMNPLYEYESLPVEIARVLFALENPEYSRDVLMSYVKV